MDGKHAFNAFAIADAADGEGLIQAAAAFANHHAGENLDALLVAFHHFGVHPHGIAHREIHGVFAKLFRFDFVEYCLVHKILGGVMGHGVSVFHQHRYPKTPSPRCPFVKPGLRSVVLFFACSSRHFSISAWLPESSTSGTFIPRNSAGRVYCGYSSSPWLNDSSCELSSSPNTPGSRRVTASMTTMAGRAPLVST